MSSELRFGEAVIDQSYRGVADIVATEQLKKTLRTFIANIDRVVGQLRAPTFMMYIGHFINLAQMVQAEKAWGDRALEIMLRESPQLDDPSFAAGVIFQLAGNRETIQEQIEYPDESRWKAQAEGVDQYVLGFAGPLVRSGLEAILSAAIVGTWTAFEVLAQDMWNETVRLHPGDLLSRAKASGDQSQIKRQKTLNLKVDVEDFIRSSFTIRYEIASFIKEMHGMEFQSYDKISTAYQTTFQQSFPSLDTRVDRALFDLAQTRNVIVHNAGIADRPFVERMVAVTSPLPQFAGIVEDQRVPIDGETTRVIVDKSIKSCVKLISDVDSWLSAKREGVN